MFKELKLVGFATFLICVAGVFSFSNLFAAEAKTKAVVPVAPIAESKFLAQDPSGPSRTVKGTLGVLDYSLLLPRAWSEGVGMKAKLALQSDGNDLLPVFSFENGTGGVIYGTWRTFREGQIFSAATIGGGIPPFSSDWGINKDDVFNKVATVGNLDYAVLIASGPGDGLAFSVASKKRMTAVWVDIPVAYKDKAGVQSGLASIYYRGPLVRYAEAKGLLDALMESLSPNQVSLMTVGEFRSLFAAKATTSAPAPASKPTTQTSSATSKETRLLDRVGELEKEAERLLKSIQDLKKSLP